MNEQQAANRIAELKRIIADIYSGDWELNYMSPADKLTLISQIYSLIESIKISAGLFDGCSETPADKPKHGDSMRVGAIIFECHEADPQGRSPNSKGSKLDAGKNRLGLVLGDFAHALQEVGHVGTFGAAKYTDHGWLSVPNGIARYTDAMYRHLMAEGAGEQYDSQSQLLHAAHTAWNALARLELMLLANRIAPPDAPSASL